MYTRMLVKGMKLKMVITNTNEIYKIIKKLIWMALPLSRVTLFIHAAVLSSSCFATKF